MFFMMMNDEYDALRLAVGRWKCRLGIRCRSVSVEQTVENIARHKSNRFDALFWPSNFRW